MRRWLRLAVIAAVLGTAAAASAQSAPAGVPATQSWSAQGGVQTFALRDISRTTNPPDASPVAWRGSGPVLSGHYERTGVRAAQLFDGAIARAGSFSYASPIDSTPALD